MILHLYTSLNLASLSFSQPTSSSPLLFAPGAREARQVEAAHEGQGEEREPGLRHRALCRARHLQHGELARQEQGPAVG
eukprot:6205459-Pleurochrysis_carterae.AAC.3